MGMKEEQLFKYFRGETSEEEEREIYRWYSFSKANEDRFYKTRVKYIASSFEETSQKSDVEVKWEKFQALKVARTEKKKNLSNTYNFLRYAALLVLLVGSGYIVKEVVPDRSGDTANIPEGAITLQLADGEIKVLEEGRTTDIANNHGQIVGKQHGDMLISPHATSSVAGDEEIAFNTLKVPYAKRFRLILSDGSEVTLNAGTSITYPTVFHSNKIRQVFVQGEAFFEVEKDSKRPFVVSSGDMNVRVLGTRFNVSSYPEDENIKTVLVEGKVNVYKEEERYDKNTAVALEPGQMAVWDRQQRSVSLEEVETDMYTAWINGKIVFKHTPFPDIVKKLERHYDVNITNRNPAFTEEFFTASFDVETIEQVMETFKRGYGLEYSIQGKEIIIKP
ncbi:FecR domain-containing protein [Sinomicrobium kalidii]|uniref:FecR family protein n=1 Tax=Sinomicrobium kalidii TaxID=2900738 RepID=UPI001E2F9546|nr:FecR family protein [Sinomicrobium kalidii]UGU15442.1 FecR domain-containing protein [Sinomicrobium kalidii]